MPTKKGKLTPRKTTAPPASSELDGSTRQLKSISDQMADIALALRALADAAAMSVIARNGTEEDRANVVADLKGWFEGRH
jgi:hypothetical protein